MNIEGLTPEQQEKIKDCSTPEEILAVAQEEGYELSDDELDAVSGGWKEPCTTLNMGYCEPASSMSGLK